MADIANLTPERFNARYPNGFTYNVEGRMTGRGTLSYFIHPASMKGIALMKNTPVSAVISMSDKVYNNIDCWLDNGMWRNHETIIDTPRGLYKEETIIYSGQNTKNSKENIAMDNIKGTRNPIRMIVYNNKTKTMHVLGYYFINRKVDVSCGSSAYVLKKM